MQAFGKLAIRAAPTPPSTPNLQRHQRDLSPLKEMFRGSAVTVHDTVGKRRLGASAQERIATATVQRHRSIGSGSASPELRPRVLRR
ncbi:hypothetical protein A5671_21760 [Mycolicibacter heraklionensis]|nr:hypothetical protein A5671_21760 [Mycolicibacter heraklionensis]